MFIETSHVFCLFLTLHDTVTASFVMFVMCQWQQPLHVMGSLLQQWTGAAPDVSFLLWTVDVRRIHGFYHMNTVGGY